MTEGGSRSCPAARTYAVHLDEKNRVLVATTPEAPREELLAAAVSPAIEVTTAAFHHIQDAVLLCPEPPPDAARVWCRAPGAR
jgi:hypothetical protein